MDGRLQRSVIKPDFETRWYDLLLPCIPYTLMFTRDRSNLQIECVRRAKERRTSRSRARVDAQWMTSTYGKRFDDSTLPELTPIQKVDEEGQILTAHETLKRLGAQERWKLFGTRKTK